MTEQEFKQQLDQVITNGLNTLGVGVVYSSLATINRFVEVVYDASVIENINAQRAAHQAAQIKAAEDAKNPAVVTDVASTEG